MIDVSYTQLALLAGIYMLAFSVKGLVGYGAAPTLIVLGTLVVPPHQAILLAALANLMTHIQFVPEGWRHGDRKLAFGMALFLIPSILLGVWVFKSLDSARLSIVAGGLLAIILMFEMSGLIARFEPAIIRSRYFAGPVAASISGLISGVVGAGSMIFLSVYIRLCCPDKQTFRATIFLTATVMIGWRTSVLIATGMIDRPLLIEAAILAPIGFLGGYTGSAVAARLSNRNFFSVYRALLFTGAVALIARGI